MPVHAIQSIIRRLITLAKFRQEVATNRNINSFHLHLLQRVQKYICLSDMDLECPPKAREKTKYFCRVFLVQLSTNFFCVIIQFWNMQQGQKWQQQPGNRTKMKGLCDNTRKKIYGPAISVYYIQVSLFWQLNRYIYTCFEKMFWENLIVVYWRKHSSPVKEEADPAKLSESIILRLTKKDDLYSWSQNSRSTNELQC